MNILIREYRETDLPALTAIWNEIVEEGISYPQDEQLSPESAAAFFSSQSFTAVAEIDGRVCGFYILHPNNIGRCGHIANASYGVAGNCRGQHIGRALVTHSLEKGAELGYRILQFNAVVKTNAGAINLYTSLGFTPLGTIPKGFRMKDGHFEDIIPFYHPL
ncbi:MAG: GNAT family N-acetyltransferase [Methanocorpusculum sp.]|nr:GNAT family N-acetyltransferase [Methanocorpusculum sp.]